MKSARHLFASMMIMAVLFSQIVQAATRNEMYPELVQEKYLFEVVRHLYRWYMDEADINRAATSGTFEFRVRAVNTVLDPDDHSKLGEILLPVLGISVKVKKADYAIPEFRALVTSRTFKITGVARGVAATTNEFTEVKVDYASMRDYLFRTRRDVEFPDDVLLMRLRLAVRGELKADLQRRGLPPLAGEQIVHISPLSPVANELWVFWETGRRLIRFSSDIDMSSPAVWDHEELAVKVYNIDEQVVVALDETPGSNAYMTREQVGRALYNCVVMGHRVELTTLEDKEEKKISSPPGPYTSGPTPMESKP